MFNYSTKGVCAKEITFDVCEGKIQNVKELEAGGIEHIDGLRNIAEKINDTEAKSLLSGIISKKNSFSSLEKGIIIRNQKFDHLIDSDEYLSLDLIIQSTI